MNYQVKLEALADKQVEQLDKNILKRLRDRLRELSLNPLDPRISKPITMAKNRRSSRVGDWRIIYYLDDHSRTVFVAAIRHRQQAYNKF